MLQLMGLRLGSSVFSVAGRLWMPLALGLVLAKVTVAGATSGLTPADFVAAPRVVLQDEAGRALGETPLFSSTPLMPGDQVTEHIVARNEGRGPAVLSVRVDGTSPLVSHPRGLQAALIEDGAGAVYYQGPLQGLGDNRPVTLPAKQATCLRLTVSLPNEAPAELGDQQLSFALTFVVAQPR